MGETVRRGWLAGLVCLVCLLAATASAHAGQKRVVILVADRLSVAELNGTLTPGLSRLLDEGALGLMSGGGPDRDPASAYATIGAGTRVSLGGRAGPAFMVDELCGATPAGYLYVRRWGGEATAAIVIPTWPEILRAAAGSSPGARPGGLGSAAASLGLVTALVGNSDRPGEARRWASLLVADERGRVSQGVLSAMVERRSDAPFGVTTAWDNLLAATRESLLQASLIAVDTGQTLRADEYAGYCTPVQAARLKAAAVRELDAFVGLLLELVDPKRDLVLLISPTPPGGPNQPPRPSLVPVIAWGRGVTPGLLTSPATRWPGVVTPTDLAPAILDFFGGPAGPGMIGRGFRTQPTPDHRAEWGRLESRLAANEERRAPLLRGYVLTQIGVVAAVLAVAWLALPFSSLLRPLLLALTAAPLGFLLLGVFPHWPVAMAAVAVIGFSLGISLLLHRRGNGVTPFVVVTLATALALTADVLGGCQLIRHSPLGYSPVGAFRFYGLGNELMGVYVGACLVACCGLADHGGRRAFPACALGLGLATAVLASPTLGANLGGSLTAAVAFSWTLASLMGPSAASRRAAMALAAGVAVVLLAAGLDALVRPPSLQSHLGVAGRDALHHGLGALLPTLERKLVINLRLIRYTIWSRVFVSSLAGFALLFYRPPGLVRHLLRQHPALARGFTGVMLGALVALLVNDSGVVAAATMMVYATATLGYLALGEPRA